MLYIITKAKFGNVLMTDRFSLLIKIGAVSSLGLFATACTPTVRVEVPDKPIEINLNINMKIEQNVRVQVEKDIEAIAKENPGIF